MRRTQFSKNLQGPYGFVTDHPLTFEPLAHDVLNLKLPAEVRTREAPALARAVTSAWGLKWIGCGMAAICADENANHSDLTQCVKWHFAV